MVAQAYFSDKSSEETLSDKVRRAKGIDLKWYVSMILGEAQMGRSSRSPKWCCPFHNEDSPSFVVYPNGKWKCYGACNCSGDIIDFVRRYNSLGDREWDQVFEILLGAQTVRTARPAKIISFKTAAKPKRVLTMQMVEDYAEALNGDYTYWINRGISKKTIQQQLLGLNHETRKYKMPDGEWLTFPSQRYVIPYWSGQELKGINQRLDIAYVRERISGPDADQFEWAKHGIMVARKMDALPTDEQAIKIIYGAKYIKHEDGAQFPYYNANLFWELDEQGHVVKKDNKPVLRWWPLIIIVEGEIDALSLLDCGYPAVRVDQSHGDAHKAMIAWLFSEVERVLVLADGDDAGQAKAEYFADILGRKCQIAQALKGHKDANEMITANVIDRWAETYRALPYYEPRTSHGGSWYTLHGLEPRPNYR